MTASGTKSQVVAVVAVEVRRVVLHPQLVAVNQEVHLGDIQRWRAGKGLPVDPVRQGGVPVERGGHCETCPDPLGEAEACPPVLVGEQPAASVAKARSPRPPYRQLVRSQAFIDVSVRSLPQTKMCTRACASYQRAGPAFRGRLPVSWGVAGLVGRFWSVGGGGDQEEPFAGLPGRDVGE